MPAHLPQHLWDALADTHAEYEHLRATYWPWWPPLPDITITPELAAELDALPDIPLPASMR